MGENALIRALKELCLFLEKTGVDYMLVGGLAVGIWGQPRATVDIDFLIAISVGDCESFRSRAEESDLLSSRGNRTGSTRQKSWRFRPAGWTRNTLLHGQQSLALKN